MCSDCGKYFELINDLVTAANTTHLMHFKYFFEINKNIFQKKLEDHIIVHIMWSNEVF